MKKKSDYSICVVGLGYVGLPLALALAKHFEVLVFRIQSAFEIQCIDLTRGNEEARTMNCQPSHSTQTVQSIEQPDGRSD